MDTMLSTGRVADLLGVSRQHVVDMCERGDLAFSWVGKHRRVLSSEVERLTHPALTREEQKLRWLHHAVLGELVADPDGVLATARNNLRRWRGVHRPDGMTARYLDQWGTVLTGGVEAIAEVLTGTLPTHQELRQNSPFAGVLTDTRRRQVLAAYKSHRASTRHSTAA